MLSIGDRSWIQGYKLVESKRMEKYTSCKTATVRKLEWLYVHQKKKTVRQKNITKDKEEHFTIIKGSIHQENMTIIYMHIYIYICAQPNRASKHMKQKMTEERETDNPTIIVKDFRGIPWRLSG